ncbi:receptor kinase-like protein Xa21 [Nicotiana sylvestris]|uniref:receptor kinase-like protein Xa21 n=1 Tax=Nicotiana sylvestris TaxID=4096 RepID=UPI00388C5196
MALMGRISQDFGNLTFLVTLDLGSNNFYGKLPQEMARLRRLRFLDLSINNFSGRIEVIALTNNSLLGSLPNGLCSRLPIIKGLYLSTNKLHGQMPTSLSNCSELQMLSLSGNELDGAIHKEIGSLRNLQVTGSVPISIFNISSMQLLALSKNNLNVSLSQEIDNLTKLQVLDLEKNMFTGEMPKEISNLVDLDELSLGENSFSGLLQMMTFNISGLRIINLVDNDLSGTLLSNIGLILPNIESLYLGELANLVGTIPHSISNLPKLAGKQFNLRLIAKLPHFLNQLQKFDNSFSKFEPSKWHSSTFHRYRKGKRSPQQAPSLSIATRERISDYELLQATDALSKSNLIGFGSFGSVYKGILRSRTPIAVKVSNLQLEAAFKSFDTECDVLRNLRHRNLVKFITSCSNLDFKALVLEYMPYGSLDKWLYSHNYFLDIMQRLNIMIDMVCALEYLHYECSSPVIHCDLKPSNVLLDENMVAHLSDFGISKLLGEEESDLYTKILATLGYIAPEYGPDGLVSTKCDVYSYGIMLLETFTRRKPNDEMFDGDLSLKQWVSYSLPEAILDVVDANLVTSHDNHLNKKLDCVASIMKVALDCYVESPARRIDMKDVVGMLHKIKIPLLAC